MSEINPLWGDDTPVEADPQGAPDVDGITTDAPVVDEPRSYLDLDNSRDHYVRVKVDGEDVEVPLHEALAGYSRTADYTRKTQELATQRQEAEYALAVQRALRAQPQMALQLLAQQYGIDFAAQAPQQQQPQRGPAYDDDDDYLGFGASREAPTAPLERRLAAVEQQWQQRQADEQLRQAIGGLQQRYAADDATVREVVGTALQQGWGPESFDMIYKTIAFDRAQTARAAAQQQAQAIAAQRQQSAQQAASMISNGGSASMAGTSPAPTATGPVSIQEAFAMAEQQLGYRVGP